MKSLDTLKTLLIFISIFISTSLYAVELANDTFDNSNDGWSGTGVSNSNGSLVIDRDSTASKTYTFAGYANQTLTIEFSAEVPNAWEDDTQNNTDYFNVVVIGSTTQTLTYYSSGGTINETFTAIANSSGSITLSFNPDTTSDNEDAEIDWVTIDANEAPVADAGSDETITVGDDITLDGSGSSDSDGTIVSYEWSTGDTGVSPTVSGLAEGTHTITLTVKDDDGATDTDTVIITVNPATGNQDPVANAGPDQSITVGGSVILDGSGSNDSDGTITSYSWVVGGTTYTGVTQIVSGLAEDTYTVVLTVTDNEGATDTDEMVITVTSSTPPTDFTCANPRTFSVAYYGNLPGQVDIIGNSVVCEDDGSGNCTDPGNTRNNSIDMMYINEDSDPLTFNHSSAELNIPADSQVRWAGLYWQGLFAGPTSDNQNNSKTIKLKVPGGTYADITSDNSKHNWVYLDEANDRWMYQGVADITDQIDIDNPNGYYEIANLHTATGTPAGGSFGAWSIVIVYYNKDMPIRNLTVFDGYQGVMPGGNGADCDDRSGDPKKACEYAEANNCPIDLASTGVANPISVPLTGFLTPKGGAVESSLGLFTGEGDRGLSGDQLSITNKSGVASYVFDGQNPINDIQNATISRNGVQVTTLEPQATLAGGTPWINTLGADIDLFDISDKLENDQSSTILTMDTNGDGYFPGVFAFSTELYQPELCYDYAYKQYERYFTEDNNGSYLPKIFGSGLSTTPTAPITVELFIQNTEISDISLSNVTVDIFDINTTQATYIPSSTYIVRPGEVFPVLNTDTDSGPAHNYDISIGDIDSQDFFYLDYNLTALVSDINMPLNIRLNYNVTFPVTVGDPINIQYETYLNTDIPLCTSLNFQYLPSYGEFNVEDTALAGSESDTTGQIYNLPTQTANRPGDFKVAAYDIVNTNTRKNISTIVGLELIDAGKYHGIDAACKEPDSALTPRIWTYFDNNVSLTDFNYDTITNAIADGRVSDQLTLGGSPIQTAGEFYSNVRENTAFRITYNTLGDNLGLIVTEDMGNGRIKIVNFPDLVQDITYCKQTVKKPNNNTTTDRVSVACSNAGNNSTAADLALCMECLYGYNTEFLCSRDNFAIRPESFRVQLTDQDQDDETQRSFIALNDDTTVVHDSDNTNDTGHQIAAGYQYAFELNATNHENETPTPGYDASFLFDGENGDRTFQLKWHTVTNDSTFCNDIEDQNKTVTLFNGQADINISSDQVGKYDLNLYDRLWTRVDWDPTVMTHHAGTHFLTGKDCVENSSYVPSFPSATAISGANLTNVSGCDITTDNHINSDTAVEYADLPLRVHPYTFNQAGVTPAIGPYTRTNGQTFVYIDTPPTMDANDTEMSYNMNGTFFATGHPNVYTGRLSNFVTGCYAADVDMDLIFTYNIPEPAITPYLSYSLKDHNTTNDTVIYRPASGTDDFEVGNHNSSTTPFIIMQDEAFFAKEMNGSITMDLGYNFVRTYNQPLNPRFITFHDFNLTYNVNPTGVRADLESDYQIFGNKDLDQNVTFVYGRAKPSQYFYDDVVANSILTPNSIVVYCDQDPITCSAVYNIEDAALRKTEEFDWYLSNRHDTDDGDGNITLVASAGGSVAPTAPNAIAINTGDGGVNNPDVNVSANAGTDRPLDVFINFGNKTNRWLIYNQYLDAIPSPYYRVRFIGQSDWAGAGDTGHTVGGETSIQKNRRLGW